MAKSRLLCGTGTPAGADVGFWLEASGYRLAAAVFGQLLIAICQLLK
jgi:hypothetical protein